MSMNRVQFQKGMSLSEFMSRYATEQACEEELQAQRWPQGFACPSCSSAEYSNFRRGRLLYYQDEKCVNPPRIDPQRRVLPRHGTSMTKFDHFVAEWLDSICRTPR